MSQEDNNLEQKDLCADCNKLVTKRFVKFHSSNTPTETKKRRKYCDESGRLWHGKKCPECAVKWRKEAAQKKIEDKKEFLKKQLGE